MARGRCSSNVKKSGATLGFEDTLWAAADKLRNLVSELQRSTHSSVFDTIPRETFRMVRSANVPVELAFIFDKTVSPLLKHIIVNLRESQNLLTIRDMLLPKLLSGEIRTIYKIF